MQDNHIVVEGIKILNDKEFIHELIKKLLEETNEMANAKSEEEMKAELADLCEVLDYLKNTLNVTNKELNVRKKQKLHKNGGFKDRIYIEDVGVEEGNKWLKYYCDNPEKYPEVNLKP